jgi:membrane-bound ClpP family serine protease
VDSLLDEPAVVLLLLALAAALFVVEVALPTAGLAGTLAIVLAVTAVIAIDRQGAEWWPLLGPMIAVLLWVVMIARRSRTRPLEIAAAVLFGAGSIAFGLLADSPGTAAIGALTAVALGAAFPRLHDAACRLLEGPSKVGMDSLVGAHGVVAAWDGRAGTVIVQGSRWNAVAREGHAEGDEIEVVGFTGMTVQVARRVRHGDWEVT